MIRGSDVTVVIPTIPGREALLARALMTVKQQDVQPGAVHVQLDTAREGAATTRNKAIEQVTTSHIAWLDDDDELMHNHLKVLVRGANSSGADMVYSYARFVGGRDPLACVHKGQLVAEPIDVPWDSEARMSLTRYGNFIPVTYLVRTDLVRRVGGFPQPNTFHATYSGDCEDYGLLLRLLDAGATFHHVTGVRTWRYFFHDKNTGGRGS